MLALFALLKTSFIPWFFSSPTPIIAVISAVIAFAAYMYQRAEKRKKFACEIADRYATSFLPRIRYIGKVLEQIELSAITANFSNFEKFDEDELKTKLSTHPQMNCDEFEAKFDAITKSDLQEALSYSGNAKYMQAIHEALLANQQCGKIGVAFHKFVLDMLNELEGMAISLKYNIADEKIIYQALHQTYCKHMKNWYYFIAVENHSNENRYYSNIISIYMTWYKRNEKNKRSIQKFVSKKGLGKSL